MRLTHSAARRVCSAVIIVHSDLYTSVRESTCANAQVLLPLYRFLHSLAYSRFMRVTHVIQVALRAHVWPINFKTEFPVYTRILTISLQLGNYSL